MLYSLPLLFTRLYLLQSTKMVLKLRESRIASLERNIQKPVANPHPDVTSLQEEISILKRQLEHHPEVTRFAVENLELRGTHYSVYTA